MISTIERKRYEMLVRVGQFGDDNLPDFPPGSVGAEQFAIIQTAIRNIESKSADKVAGFGEAALQFEVKDTCRENLRDELAPISRTARSMEYRFTGISNKFAFRRNMTDAAMLATARAFASEAAAYEADFIAYRLPPTFIADLNAAADAFEAAFAATASAKAGHISATAENAGHIKAGLVAVRILDGIVKNIYANSIGKLAAWLSASHIEKAPRRKKEETIPAPPPTTATQTNPDPNLSDRIN